MTDRPEDAQTRSGFICAGNWIVDIVHELDHWPQKSGLANIAREVRGVGGGAANVIMALARFDTGLPLLPVGAIGQDEHAELILATCHELGLETAHLARRDTVPTAHTHVMSVPGDSRTFFYQGGANDTLSLADFPEGMLRGSGARIFYLGYLMLLSELDRITADGSTAGAALLKRARKAGLVTCVDLVSAERADYAQSVAPSLPFIDYLIANEQEVCRASETPPPKDGSIPEDATILAAASALLAKGVAEAVIVHCPQKALWLGRNAEPVWVRPTPLKPEEVLSPVGAGDAFCTGILYAVHEGLAPDKALRLGHSAARASLAGMTATDAIPAVAALLPALEA